MYDMYDEHDYNMKKEELNNRLKNIKTYEEFKELEKEVDEYDFHFCSKKSFKTIYHFTHLYENEGFFRNPYAGVEKYKNKVHYLYDDQMSTGTAYVKNLYKYFEIR